MRTVATRRVVYDDPMLPQVLRRHRSAARPKFKQTNDTTKLKLKQTENKKKLKNPGEFMQDSFCWAVRLTKGGYGLDGWAWGQRPNAQRPSVYRFTDLQGLAHDSFGVAAKVQHRISQGSSGLERKLHVCPNDGFCRVRMPQLSCSHEVRSRVSEPRRNQSWLSTMLLLFTMRAFLLESLQV